MTIVKAPLFFGEKVSGGALPSRDRALLVPI